MTSTIVDLYGGPGGWDEAARNLGLRPVGYELDPHACATRAAAGHLTIRQDVATAWVPPLLGVIASPPCQAFSSAGKQLGKLDLPRITAHIVRCRDGWQPLPDEEWADERSKHVLQPLRWAWYGQPEWIACEQVPQVLTVWRGILHVLGRWGYRGWAAVLNAADYSVPQTRKRAFLVAARGRMPRHPEVTHVDGRPGASLFDHGSWVSMETAVGWDPDAVVHPPRGAGMTERHGERPPTPVTQPSPTVRAGVKGSRNLVIDRRTNSKDGRGGMVPTVPVEVDRPAPTVSGKAGGQWRLRNHNQENAAVRDLDEPAGTIYSGHHVNDIRWVRERPATTVQGTPRIAKPGHKDRDGGESAWEESVPVTLDELAALQAFPPDYPWQGNKSQRAEQIGNAVPPPLAEAVLRTVIGND